MSRNDERTKSNNVVESRPSTQAPISEVGRIIILRVYKGFIIIHYALISMAYYTQIDTDLIEKWNKNWSVTFQCLFYKSDRYNVNPFTALFLCPNEHKNHKNINSVQQQCEHHH